MATDPGVGLKGDWHKPVKNLPANRVEDLSTMYPTKVSPSISIMSMTQVTSCLEGAFEHVAKRLDAHERIFYDLAGGKTKERKTRMAASRLGGSLKMPAIEAGEGTPISLKLPDTETTQENDEKRQSQTGELPEGEDFKDRELDLQGLGAPTDVPEARFSEADAADAEDDADAEDGSEEHTDFDRKFAKMEKKRSMFLGDLPEEVANLTERMNSVETLVSSGMSGMSDNLTALIEKKVRETLTTMRSQQEEAGAMRSELTDLQIKLGEFMKFKLKVEEDLEKLKDLETLKENVVELHTKIDPIDELAGNLQADVGSLSERIDELDELTQQLKAEKDEVQEEVHELQTKSEEIRQMLDALKKEGGITINSSSTTNNTVADHTQEDEFLHSRIDDVKEELRKAKRDIAKNTSSYAEDGDLSKEMKRISDDVAGAWNSINILSDTSGKAQSMLERVRSELLERLDGLENRMQQIGTVEKAPATTEVPTEPKTPDLPTPVKVEKNTEMIRSLTSRVDKLGDGQTEQRTKIDMLRKDLTKISKDVMDKILEKIKPLLGGAKSSDDWSAVSASAGTGELGAFRLEFDNFKEQVDIEHELRKHNAERLDRLDDQLPILKDLIDGVKKSHDTLASTFPTAVKRIGLLEAKSDQDADKMKRLKSQVDILISSSADNQKPKSRLASQKTEGRELTSRELRSASKDPPATQAVLDSKTLDRLQKAEDDIEEQARSTEELRVKLQEGLDELRSADSKEGVARQRDVQALASKVEQGDEHWNARLSINTDDVGRLKHDILKLKDLETSIGNLKSRVEEEAQRGSKNPQDKGLSKEMQTRGFLMIEDRLLKMERRQGVMEDYTQKFVKRVADGTTYDQVQNIAKSSLNNEPGYPNFPGIQEVIAFNANKDMTQKADEENKSKIDASKLSEVRDIALKTQSAVVALQSHMELVERQAMETKDMSIPGVHSRIDRLEISLDLQEGVHGSSPLTEAALREVTGSGTSRATMSTGLPPVIDSIRGQSEEDIMDDVRTPGHSSGRSPPLMPQRPSTSAGLPQNHRRSVTLSNRPSTGLDNPMPLADKMKGFENHLQAAVLEKALLPLNKLDSRVTEDLDKKGREITQLARRVAEIDCRMSLIAGSRSGGASKRSTARH